MTMPRHPQGSEAWYVEIKHIIILGKQKVECANTQCQNLVMWKKLFAIVAFNARCMYFEEKYTSVSNSMLIDALGSL